MTTVAFRDEPEIRAASRSNDEYRFLRRYVGHAFILPLLLSHIVIESSSVVGSAHARGRRRRQSRRL